MKPKQKITWLLGAFIILSVALLIFIYPYTVLIYPGLPYIGLYKRALFILLFSSLLCLYRIMRGPTASDRIVATDILGILIVGFCAILSIPTGRNWYIDIAIAWALQSFIGTLALSKYLEGRGFDE